MRPLLGSVPEKYVLWEQGRRCWFCFWATFKPQTKYNYLPSFAVEPEGSLKPASFTYNLDRNSILTSTQQLLLHMALNTSCNHSKSMLEDTSHPQLTFSNNLFPLFCFDLGIFILWQDTDSDIRTQPARRSKHSTGLSNRWRGHFYFLPVCATIHIWTLYCLISDLAAS